MGLFHIFADAFDLMIVKYTSVATATLCVYEFLLTLDSEMRLVWPSRFNYVKVLFVANRYMPFLITFGNAFVLVFISGDGMKFCGPAFLAIGLIQVAGITLAEVVLAVRVYAVWKSMKARRSILVLLYFIVCAMSLAAFAVTYFSLSSAKATPIRLFPSGCESLFEERAEWIIIFVVFFFEIVIFSLFIVARRAYMLEMRSKMAAIVIDDGIFYCSCVMTVSLVNVFVVRLAPAIISPFLLILQGTLHNILCTRLLLHLREADARKHSTNSLEEYTAPPILEEHSVPPVVFVSTTGAAVSR